MTGPKVQVHNAKVLHVSVGRRPSSGVVFAARLHVFVEGDIAIVVRVVITEDLVDHRYRNIN